MNTSPDQQFREAIERAEEYVSDLIHTAEEADIDRANTIISKLSKRIA